MANAEFTDCPEWVDGIGTPCSLRATIIGRQVLRGAGSPVDLIITECSAGHIVHSEAGRPAAALTLEQLLETPLQDL